MTIQPEFKPERDGWSFINWDDANLSWELFRRTYLGINPTNDPIAAPLDSAYYEIYKGCAKHGNCGGMSLLGLALYKFGGFMGYCAPANFYSGPTVGGGPGPDRADLHAAINVMHGRQFSAAAIQNFVDTVNATKLNDADAAYKHVEQGLASGDYVVISLATSWDGDDAHTLIPYAVEQQSSGRRFLYLWDPNRPWPAYKEFYTGLHNRLQIDSAQDWSYDQNYTDTTLGPVSGHHYKGSDSGWCFTIATSLQFHKGPHPMSLGFGLTNLATLFIKSTGSVTQIEDDSGRRMFKTNARHANRVDLETDSGRALQGVGRWPWYAAGGPRGERPGDLYLIDRDVVSSPLTVTVQGAGYRVIHGQPGQLVDVEVEAAASARDRIRIADLGGPDQSIELRTRADGRTFHVRQLRSENADGDWRSVELRNLRVDKGHVRIGASEGLRSVEVASVAGRHRFDVSVNRFVGGSLSTGGRRREAVGAGEAVRLQPRDWSATGSYIVERERRSSQGDRPARPRTTRRRPSAD